MKNYPRGFLLALLVVCLLAWIGGVLLAPTTLALRLEWPLPWRLPAPARLAVAALHTAAAFALAFLCGALWARHMRRGWRCRRQRASGMLMSAILLVLAVTALFIFYAGDDALAHAAALIHLGAGLLLALPLAWHGLRPRRRRPS
jgi:predicted lysophospholipase L1 biosynthesis ABC-type transport system permease subunit